MDTMLFILIHDRGPLSIPGPERSISYGVAYDHRRDGTLMYRWYFCRDGRLIDQSMTYYKEHAEVLRVKSL